MARACASLSACILHPHGFTITVWELPCFFPVELNSLHLRFAVVSSSYLPLCRRCLGYTLVLRRCLKWLRLVLCRQLTVFGIANLPSRLCRCCSCFAVALNGLRLRFAVSSHSLPSLLCRHCSCFALVLRCRGKLIALAPSLQMACAHALPLAHVRCPR
jgi:hypothetical protein